MGSSLPRVSGSNRHERRKLAALQRQAEKSSRLARRFQSLESLEKRELLSSIQVTIDYSFDTNGFFNDPLRRELMQAAANIVVRDFTDTLDAINPDANNTWTADFTHPGTGADESVANRIIAANEIVIFAGGRNLGGPLGEGGPGGFSISFFDQAFANAVVGRGEPGALGAQASRTDFASWGGSVTFDNTATWHFGFSTDGLDAGENDFLSVAMHEVAHLLGFGTSASFQNLINFGNGTFTGAKSVLANGGNAVPLADAGHWQNGIQSGGQEAAMDPNLTVGTRKMMTPLDNAGLDDLGWDLVPAIGVVTNTNDSGPGSLRQAILDLNAGIVPVDTITFNINVNDPGFIDIDSALPLGDADADVFRINLESELPDIIRPNSSINGESQSFYLASDLNVFGPEIWIRGGAIPNGSSVNGLTLDAANIFIHHLVITGFDSGFSAGIFLTNNADDSTVERNYLGVDPTGLTAEANDNGVFVDGADNVRILGERSETPQIISGNNNQGIFIDNDAIGALIQGNFIGVGVDGTTAIANFQHGVSIRSGSDHFVGVNPAIEAFQDGNTIAGNAIEGVHLEGPVTGVTIAGNRIGIGDNGVAVPNQFGISIFGAGATGNFIGVENVAAGSNIISGNSSEGVRILAGATGNTVVRNFIGTNENGDAAVPNGGLAGVLVEASDGNAIGTADNGNVISGNDGDGVLLRAFDGDGADGNTIVGNLIGVAADGFTGLGNGARGVAIFNSSGNSVGGDGDQSFSNVISANAQEGVAIFDEDFEGETLTATNNTILNNFIGIDRDEAADGLGNGGAGVRIEAGDGNIIGGFINGEAGTLGGNVIVDNAGSGIELVRSADGNQILGNFIGVTRNNLAAGNFGDGVAIRDSSGNLVGIDAVGTENVIGGNTGTGVSIIDFLPIVGVAHAGPANFNVVLNNFIGTDNSGTLDLGNVGEGIYISAGSNRVGQVNTNGQTVFPNTIAFNGEAGEPGIAVSILEAAAFAINNSLRGNTIFNNSGIAIDLADVNSGQRFDGVTPNDFLDGDGGPNTQQNFPVITTANATGPSLTVAGTLSAGIGSGQYFIDIYANGRHIGHTLPTVDNAGFANFNVTLPNANVTAGQTITATATQVTNQSTSEHSAAFLATADIVPFDVVVESKSFFSNAVNPFFDVFIDAPPGVVAAIAGYNIGLRISPFGAGVTLLAPIAGNDPLIAGTPDNPTVVPQVLTVADDVSAGAVAIVDDKDFFRVPISIAPGTVGTFDVTIDPVLFQLVDGGGVELDASLFNLVNGTITISTPPLEVSIGDPAAVTEGNAGTQTVTFPVTLSANPTSAVTVTVSTANNTAVAGGVSSTGANDYVAKTQTFTFNPGGALTQNFTVTINGDTVKELNETFFANITGTTGPVTSITNGQGVGTINDNDTIPAILVTDVTLTEGDTGKKDFIFTVNLTAAHGTSNVSVNFATAGVSAVTGSDFDANSGTLTFGPTETSKTITVKVNGDFAAESNETFQLNFSSPVNATLPDAQAIGTITNDDTRLLNIDDVSIAEGDTGTKQMVFTVSLNEPAGPSGVSVNFATGNFSAVANTDYLASTGTVTFAPGETSKPISITINGDFTAESNETFQVNLSNIFGADFASGGSQGIGTITNDDTRLLNIDDVSVLEGDSGETDMVFTVSLTEPAGPSGVTVAFATANFSAVAGTDYTAATGTVTFAPGETSKPITIKITGDVAIESNETFQVNLSNIFGADFAAGGSQGIGTIIDEDTRRITISDVTQNEGDAGQTDFVFNVTLSTPAAGTITVDFATANFSAVAPTDYIAQTGTVTFLAGETSKPITIKVNGDTTIESDETFRVILSNAVGAPITDAQGVGTIVNDDIAIPVVSIADAQITEGDTGTQTLSFTVSLNAAHPTSAVSGTAFASGVTASLGTDFDLVGGTPWSIPQGQTSTTVNVTIFGDFLIEPTETFTVGLFSIQNATAGDTSAVGTIFDNGDARTISVADVAITEGDAGTKDMTFTITVNQARTDGDVTGTFTTFGGSAGGTVDFDIRSNVPWTIPANQTFTTITVPIVGDTVIEADEQFTIQLFSIVGADPGVAVGSDTVATGTILNDDAPSISISDVTLAEGNGAGTTAFTFNVTISANPSAQVQVTAVTADGSATLADSDYQQLVGTPINFLPGGPLTQQVTVLVNGDTKFEVDQNFVVNLTGLTGPATIADGSATGTIANDDARPTITITGASANEGDALTFNLTLSNASDETVTVAATVNDGTATTADNDYTDINGQVITFNPGVTSQQFVVQSIEDTKFEADQTISVALSGATNASGTSGSPATGTIVNDDARPTITITGASANEGDTLTFNLTLSNASDETVTVQATVNDGTATTTDDDYTDINGQVITFNPGVTAQSFVVQTTEDNKFEADETLTVSLSGQTNATGISGSPATGTIVNDDSQPVVSISGPSSVVEGTGVGGVAAYTIALTNPSFQTITVVLNTADGSAAAGSDFTGVTGQTVTFTPGQTSQQVNVQITGDAVDENDETFSAAITTPTNATINAAAGSVTTTIIDDDGAPTLSINDVTQVETNNGATAFVFTVTLSGSSAVPVTVNFATDDGTATLADGDYQSNAGTLTFNPGGPATQTVTVMVNGDTTFEPNENFVVNLSAATNATIADGQGNGSITNDDNQPTVSINDVTVVEGNAGNTAMTFTVSLSNPSSQTITVQTETRDGGTALGGGVDYLNNALLLSFAPGQVAQTFTVQVVGDTTFELDESFPVLLAGATNATVLDANGVGTITNDDAVPAISITDAAVTEGNAGTTTATFTVSLTNASAFPISVQFNTADGTATLADSDYQSNAGTLNFPANSTSSQTITVLVNGDTKFEANQNFLVDLLTPANATIADSQAVGTINNDDARPTITITGASANEGDALTFNLTLSNASDETVTVQATVNDGTATTADNDYTDINGQVITFNPGVTAQSFVVQSIEDTKFEADQTISVALSGAVNATGTSGSPATGTIVNDDARPTITIAGASANEGDALTFNLTLSNASDETVTVQATVNDGTATTADNDYTDINGQVITFNPGVTAQSFVVQSIEDTKFEADQTISVELSGATNASGTSGSPATGTITNDDARPTITITGASANEGDALTFNLTLSNASDETVTVQATVNDGTATTADNDYTDINGQVITFNPGVTAQSFVVQSIEDTKFEADQTISVALSGAVNATGTSGSPATGTIVNDDARPTITITGASASEGDALTFNLSLSNLSDEQVSVLASTVDGSAAAGSDFAGVANQPIVFAPGTGAAQLVVASAEDGTVEPSETFTVELSGATNAGGVSGSPATGTIIDDDGVTTISVNDVAISEGNAGTTKLDFTITLSAPSSQTITVLATITDGTATSEDYTAGAPVVVTFSPGSTVRTVSANVLGDTKFEADQTFNITLSNPTNAVIADGAGVATILNDDARPTVTIRNANNNEGNQLTFGIELSHATDETVTMTATTNDGSATDADGDYVFFGDQPISIAPGTLLQTVTVQTNEDDKFEADETLTVLLKNLVGGVFGDDTGVGTIFNDDAQPAVSIADKTVVETDGVSVELLQLTLSNPSAFPVSVVVNTANGAATAGSDFDAIVGRTVTFNPGQTSITTPVNILGDTIRENNEAFLVNLSSPVGGTIDDGQAIVTIQDNDPLPTISINDVTQNEGTGGTTAFTFTVTLSNGSQSDVLVTLQVNDGSATVTDGDYIDGGTLLTFQNGGPLSQTFTVLVNGDATFEANETFTVALSSPVNAVIAAGDAGVGTGTILNDDGLTVSISDGQSVEGNPGDNRTIVFDVSLSAPPTELMTVNLSSFNGTATTADDDYLPLDTFLIFTPGGPTSQQVSVQVVGDDFFEFDETLEVQITNVAGSGATIADGTGIGTIINDDAQPTVSIGDVSRPENFGITSFLLPFDVTLSKATKFPVTVTVNLAEGTASSPGDFFDGSVTVTFDPGGLLTRGVAVIVQNDNIFELDETVIATITSATNATIADGTAVGTIVNDDAPPTVTISDALVLEGDNGESNDLVFNVTLSHSSHEAIGIGVIFGGTATFGTDYNGVGATILPGQTTGTIRLSTIGDNRFELDETVTIDPVLVFGQAVLPTGLATGTILNDDNAPVITIGNGSVIEGDAGETAGLAIPVSISGETDVPVTVTLDTFDGTATGSGANRDYDNDGLPSVLTFTPGGPTAFTILHTVRGDDVFEGDETFTLVASDVTNATVSGNGTGIGTIIDDEPAPTVSISGSSVLENSGFSVAQLLYTVTLSSAVSVPVTVTVVATEGTADSPEDFLAGTVTFTINPGDPLTKQVAVLVEHDNIFELDETVVATITSATNAAIADGSAVGTIVNDDAPPTVTISNASVQEGNNGESNDLVFNVTLSHPSHEAIGIGVVLGGSAVSESDYTDQVGAFIPAGATTGTVRVRTIGDNRFELDETVTIDPFLVIGQAVLPTGVAATGTILNDDAAPVITIGSGSVLEGATGETTALRIPVSISGETDLPATVTLNTFDGTATGSGANRDYDNDGLPLILTFTPGGPTSFDVLHTVRGDDVVEGNETFALVASDVTNATVAGTAAGVGTIIDDDLPTISITDVTIDEDPFLLASHDFTFFVLLSQPATQTITVDFATVDGSATTADGDYAAKSGTITFTPGTDFALVKVTVFADNKFEQDQDFFVNLSNLSGATFADPQGKGTIRNDDQRPTVSIDDAGSVTEGNLGTTPALFTIRLSNPSDEVVSVNASTADGTATSADNDYTPVNNLPIVFNPGQTQLSAAAFVRGDTKFESDQTFRMVLTGATNSSGITDSEGVATIVNDDSRPTVTITDAGNITEGNAGATPAFFNVTLSNASDEVVTVQVATQDGGATVADNDYQAVSTTLTFNPTGLLTQTVTVQVNGDTTFEPNEAFSLNVQATGNATIADGSGQAVIVNDDSNVVLAVDRIVVNDGAAQRSNIDRIEVQFTADANIQGLIDSGQIVDAIKLRNTSTGQDVVLTVSRFQFSAANRSLRIDLTTDGFGGAVTTILADGRHQLRLDTNLITVAGDGANKLVDGDGNADGIHRFNFHRYMGDFNGDGRVDVAGDVVLFNAHYLSVIGQARYDAIFDFDGNGRIDAVDLLTLRRRLNTMVAPAIE